MNKKKRKVIIIFSIVLIVLLFILPFGISIMIYEDNFGDRYETYEPMARSMDEFKELSSKRHTFASNKGQQLVGYTYYYEDQNPKGVVMIAHGLGGGGHNTYLDVADYFASNGYYVFAYDATGNDESEGDSVKGIPQGLIDLDYAIRFVLETEDFHNLPIMAFGHSWGAYSAGSVLNLHPEIKSVVMVAGFNQSMDIIEEQGRSMAGDAIDVFLPYLSLYERIKFGKYSGYSSIDGFEHSTADVMIIYSTDDEMISDEKSYDVFYNLYSNNSRFHFVKYENRGHNYVYYSDVFRKYQDEINSKFEEYIKTLDGDLTPEIKAAYLKENLDKKLLYDLDDGLMNTIVKFYDDSIE